MLTFFLNVLKELRKRDKMRGSLSLLNSIIQEYECNIVFSI